MVPPPLLITGVNGRHLKTTRSAAHLRPRDDVP